MTLGCIDAPHFCAGFEIMNGRVGNWCAPILSWARGKEVGWLQSYCRSKSWKLSVWSTNE